MRMRNLEEKLEKARVLTLDLGLKKLGFERSNFLGFFGAVGFEMVG